MPPSPPWSGVKWTFAACVSGPRRNAPPPSEPAPNGFSSLPAGCGPQANGGSARLSAGEGLASLAEAQTSASAGHAVANDGFDRRYAAGHVDAMMACDDRGPMSSISVETEQRSRTHHPHSVTP